MKKLVSTALIAASLVLFAGCKSKPPPQPPQQEQQNTGDVSGVNDANAVAVAETYRAQPGKDDEAITGR